MECDDGQVRGFTDEAVTFATALESMLDLRLEISEPWHCREAVLQSLPLATADAVMRMQQRPNGRDGGVLIVSEDEDDSEAGGAAIVIAWLIARRAVPWAEVQAVVKPCPDLIPNQKT